MKLPVVQCVHWKARPPHGGDCGLGKGFISHGVCGACPDYDGPEPRVLHPPKVTTDDLLSPARVAEIEGFQSHCRACDHWLGSFVQLKGMPVATHTKCDGCSCVHKTVNLMAGRCPKRKWSN